MSRVSRQHDRACLTKHVCGILQLCSSGGLICSLHKRNILYMQRYDGLPCSHSCACGASTGPVLRHHALPFGNYLNIPPMKCASARFVLGCAVHCLLALPPGKVLSVLAPNVSPSAGRRSTSSTMSALTLPTTTKHFGSCVLALACSNEMPSLDWVWSHNLKIAWAFKKDHGFSDPQDNHRSGDLQGVDYNKALSSNNSHSASVVCKLDMYNRVSLLAEAA